MASVRLKPLRALSTTATARPRERPQRPRVVAVGCWRPEAVAVGARKLRQDVGVEAVGLAGEAEALARRSDLVGVAGQHREPGLEQAVDQEPLRPLDRDRL